MLKKGLFSMIVVILLSGACKEITKEKLEFDDAALLHESVKLLTNVIVEDIFSPPVASRIYIYSLLAAYEVAKFDDSSFISFEGRFNELKNLPVPEYGAEYHFALAGNLALLYTGNKLIFTTDSIDAKINNVIQYYSKNGLHDDISERSIQFAKTMSEAILQYASQDQYKQTRSLPKYLANPDASTWQPTPPAYMDGIEPHWSKIRPVFMNSSSHFQPLPPTPFDTIANCRFMSEALEVFQTVNHATAQQKLIADYWDCNPYKINISGHIMHATKKITPGGHWMNITGIACKQVNHSFTESIYAYTLVAAGIFDGFISCWDEKYRSNVLRPETYINQYIDKDWKPLLQTPPFPEYTSGHSVISMISGIILTEIFGENFEFTDDTEVIFGLDSRKFNSFAEASEEAAISRLYAGIHYRPAIENGKLQGNQIAQHIIRQMKI